MAQVGQDTLLIHLSGMLEDGAYINNTCTVRTDSVWVSLKRHQVTFNGYYNW